MPLPRIATPSHELELFSTKDKVIYRPFLVREEKLLLLAMESEDVKEISTAIKAVIKNCVKSIKSTKGSPYTEEQIDAKIESLPTFDIEFLFLNLRTRSIGEEVEVGIVCPDDETTIVNTKIDISDIQIVSDPTHTKIIKINDDITMEMSYPSLEQFINSNFDVNDNNPDQSFELIASCVDKIYTKEEVFDHTDVTQKEIIEFLDQMSNKHFEMIDSFFKTMPKLSHKISITNPNTKVTSEVVLEGLQAFFG
jgi:arsenate reductase-like glutaredoxin family protein